MKKRTTALISLIGALIFTIFLTSCSKNIDRHNIVVDNVKFDVQKTKVIRPHTNGNETSDKYAIAILYKVTNKSSESIDPDRTIDSTIYPYQKLKDSNEQLTENLGEDLYKTLNKGQSAHVTRIYQVENKKDPILLQFRGSGDNQDLTLNIKK